MHRYIIIVAGGSGKRIGGATPKQFIRIKDKPILIHTIKAFKNNIPESEIILVLPQDQIDTWKNICDDYGFKIQHSLIAGGQTRFHSVKNGLSKVTRKSIVAVHDGVRPFVNKKTIEKCFEAAENYGAAIPVTEISESVRSVVSGYTRPIDRSNLRLVQTPQVFKSELIKEAYLQDYIPEFTDDASVVEKIGHEIKLVDGNPENIKITTPYDMWLAGLIAESKLED